MPPAISEEARRFVPCLLRRHSGRDELLRPHLDMELQFLVELILQLLYVHASVGEEGMQFERALRIALAQADA